MQDCQWCGVKRIKAYFREYGELWEKGLGHVFIICFHFFNKTDFEQYI